jgi:hypothetical protein
LGPADVALPSLPQLLSRFARHFGLSMGAKVLPPASSFESFLTPLLSFSIEST